MNKNTDARLAANRRYNAKTYKNMTLSVKIEAYQKIKEYTTSHNISITSYIMELVKQDLQDKGIDI